MSPIVNSMLVNAKKGEENVENFCRHPQINQKCGKLCEQLYIDIFLN